MKRIEKLYEVLKECEVEDMVFDVANAHCPNDFDIDQHCNENCYECWMAECGKETKDED